MAFRSKRILFLLFWVGVWYWARFANCIIFSFYFLWSVYGISCMEDRWVGSILSARGDRVHYRVRAVLAFELRHWFPIRYPSLIFAGKGEEPVLYQSPSGKNITDVSYRLFGELVFRLPPPGHNGEYSGFCQYVWAAGTKFSIFVSLGLFYWRMERVSLKFHGKRKRRREDDPHPLYGGCPVSRMVSYSGATLRIL